MLESQGFETQLAGPSGHLESYPLVSPLDHISGRDATAEEEGRGGASR